MKIILKRSRRVLLDKNKGVEKLPAGHVLDLKEDSELAKELLSNDNIAEKYFGEIEAGKVDAKYAKAHLTLAPKGFKSSQELQLNALEENTKALNRIADILEEFAKAKKIIM